MINVGYEHSITVTFSNSEDSQDLTTFMTVLSKCNTEAKKSGFKSMFKGKERELVTSLYAALSGTTNHEETIHADRDTVKNNVMC